VRAARVAARAVVRGHVRPRRRDADSSAHYRRPLCTRRNPTITPLVRECRSHDTILVQINPIVRDEVPKTARDIMNRLNEVAFNAPLVKELRMIALLNRVADPGRGEGAQWAGMRIHRIATERVTELDSTSKMITEWRFLSGLRDEGRRTAGLWLQAHAADLGKRSTLDLDAMLATA